MTIERIWIRPSRSESQVECEQAFMVADEGILGDRYFGCRDEPGQNLTLVEAEEIEAFLDELGRPYDLCITKRNLVTRGVRLNELVGREFMVGSVRLRGVMLCEPCEFLGKSLSSPDMSVDEVVRRFVHKAGLRADVLTSGVIKCGAKITLLD